MSEQKQEWSAEFTGRLVGAIGKPYPITATVNAVDKDSARLALYNRYEGITGLTLIPKRMW